MGYLPEYETLILTVNKCHSNISKINTRTCSCSCKTFNRSVYLKFDWILLISYLSRGTENYLFIEKQIKICIRFCENKWVLSKQLWLQNIIPSWNNLFEGHVEIKRISYIIVHTMVHVGHCLFINIGRVLSELMAFSLFVFFHEPNQFDNVSVCIAFYVDFSKWTNA